MEPSSGPHRLAGDMGFHLRWLKEECERLHKSAAPVRVAMHRSSIISAVMDGNCLLLIASRCVENCSVDLPLSRGAYNRCQLGGDAMAQQGIVYIQVIMHPYGDWMGYTTCLNVASVISQQLQDIKAANPDWRVRAVDGDGRVVDIIS
jgi:hypothetical protein